MKTEMKLTQVAMPTDAEIEAAMIRARALRARAMRDGFAAAWGFVKRHLTLHPAEAGTVRKA